MKTTKARGDRTLPISVRRTQGSGETELFDEGLNGGGIHMRILAYSTSPGELRGERHDYRLENGHDSRGRLDYLQLMR